MALGFKLPQQTVGSLVYTAQAVTPSGYSALRIFPDYGNLSATPTWSSIVDVGPGYSDTNTRQVVRTSGGVVYVVVIAAVLNGSGASSIRMYKGSPAGNPTSFAEVAAASRPSNSIRFGAVEARIGSSGTLIDVVYEDDATFQMVYRQFNTSTDTWGTAENIVALAGFTNNRYLSKLSMALDANSVPHVLYGASNGSTLSYTNRIGGAWSAPVVVSTKTSVRRTGCVFDSSGNLHAGYWSDTPPTITYRQRQSSGTWLAEETVDNVDVTGTADDQGVSVCLNGSNQPVLFYAGLSVNPDGNTYQIRVRTAASTFTNLNPPGAVGHSPAGFVDAGGHIYAFIGHDDSPIEPFVIVRNAGTQIWGAYTQLAPNPPPTRDSSANICYDSLRPSAEIDFICMEEQISSTGETWYVHGSAPTPGWVDFIIEVDNGAGFEFYTGCRWEGGQTFNKATGLPTTAMPVFETPLASLTGKPVRMFVRPQTPTLVGTAVEVL
ncbi:MAG: hypothetical protein ACREBG_23160 [Pyrinomonadaceae bacterium]